MTNARRRGQLDQGIHWSPCHDIAFNYEELFVATMVARRLRRS